MALAALLKRPLTYCVVAGALPDDLAPATQNSGALSPHVPSAFRSSNIRLTAAYALVGSVEWGYSVGTFELQPGAFLAGKILITMWGSGDVSKATSPHTGSRVASKAPADSGPSSRARSSPSRAHV